MMGGFGKLWVWRMALRDGRRGLRPLFFSMTCVVLAVASVVVAYSFRENLQASVQAQSKGLLGADLAIAGRQPFSPAAEALIASIGGDQSRQIGFTSMAFFPGSGDSRLVQVRAIGGKFPYYGALETEPAGAMAGFHDGANALVDENVMLQFNAEVGDVVRLGEHEFRIAGRLRKIPGETVAFSAISPRIYIPLGYLDRTQLIQKGSLVRYRVFFKLDPKVQVDAMVAKLTPQLQSLYLEADTVSRRTASIAATMENLSRYLQLAVFIAVLLAGVGVASIAHVYAKDKARSVALLRCLGAAPGATVAVYSIQLLGLALVCSLIGVALGGAGQQALPYALRDFVPVTTMAGLSPAGIGVGLAVGVGTALLFAMIPLLPLRRISPLSALRSSFDNDRPARDPWVWLLYLLIVAAIWWFAAESTARTLLGLWFTLGVLGVFATLYFVARAGSALLRRIAPRLLSFPWRQGLANLYRPNNQTAAVTLAIGLGTFLLVTLYGVQNMLVTQVTLRTTGGEPNLVLFDVQRGQRTGIAGLLRSHGVALKGEVPIVTMRLSSVNGRTVQELRADREANIPPWVLRREYRSTYRSTLTGTEKIVAGNWQGRVAQDAEPVPISLEKGMAENLKVGLGDELSFEVQGVPMATRVASIREVDWQRVQPNFFVVFPEGVLEAAPQFFAVVARADTNTASARLQRAVVEGFPNVSVIDLSLILTTLDHILGKVSGAMRFAALFTIVTGLAVLASAVLGSRAQRLRESILLKTLGAPRGQIVKIIIAEYLFLGAIAGAAGTCLGLLAALGLGYYFFGIVAGISLAPVAAILTVIVAATVAAGAIGCWGVFRRSPLEALRADA
jgi:putative ABC transport system permease protein